MRREYDNTARVWMFGALAFFAAVILYFLGGRLLQDVARPTAPSRPAPRVTAEAEGAGTSLPTASIRLKIKRIEPRKYRREGPAAPPAP